MEFGRGNEAELAASRSTVRLSTAPTTLGDLPDDDRPARDVQAATTTLAAWRLAWGTDDEAPLTGATDAEVYRLNHLARDELRRAGRLSGPAVVAGGIEIQEGERVVAGPAGIAWPHGCECAAALSPVVPPLEAGVVGDVAAVDLDGAWVDIDFPSAGRARFPVSGFRPGALAYGYAVSEDDLVADLTLPRLGAALAQPVLHSRSLGAEVALP